MNFQIVNTDHHLVVSGNIVFGNVTQVRAQGEKLMNNIAALDLMIDLAQVQHCDSSALSLLLSWLRFSKKINKKIAFINIPRPLLNVAEMCGIKEVLFN